LASAEEGVLPPSNVEAGSARRTAHHPFVANIQTLRFVAAAFILVNHVQHEVHDLGIQPGFVRWTPIIWSIGVDIFFVISGFMMYLLMNEGAGKPGAARYFLLRRFVRVVPSYWLFTTLMLLAIFLFSGSVSQQTPTITEVITSYSFVPWPQESGAMRPVLALGWTLNYEIFFYLACALSMLHSRGTAILAGGLILLTMLSPLVPDLFVLRFWTDPIILDFVAGLALGKLYLGGNRITPLAAAALIASAVAVSLAFANARIGLALPRPIALGVPALMICAAFALSPDFFGNGPVGRAIRVAGDASYALYLSHPFTIAIVAICWKPLAPADPLSFVIVASAGAIAVSVLLHQALEKPWLRFARLRLNAIDHRRALRTEAL
jgi:peptidoglycan/LPS O-acetylase OafA/YrhL